MRSVVVRHVHERCSSRGAVDSLRFSPPQLCWIASKVSLFPLVQFGLVLLVIYLQLAAIVARLRFLHADAIAFALSWIPSPPATHTLGSFGSSLLGSHDQWLGLDEQYQRTDYASARADATLKVSAARSVVLIAIA